MTRQLPARVAEHGEGVEGPFLFPGAEGGGCARIPWKGGSADSLAATGEPASEERGSCRSLPQSGGFPGPG